MTLAEALEAKELRAARIANFGTYAARLSFTVVMPGPDKTGPASRIIHAAGLSALREALAEACLAVAAESVHEDALGPQTILGLDAPAGQVKILAILIEEDHPIGRLFDLDVFEADGSRISRVDYGLPERRCLVCDKPASECYRERTHLAEELAAAVDKLLGSRTGTA